MFDRAKFSICEGEECEDEVFLSLFIVQYREDGEGSAELNWNEPNGADQVIFENLLSCFYLARFLSRRRKTIHDPEKKRLVFLSSDQLLLC